MLNDIVCKYKDMLFEYDLIDCISKFGTIIKYSNIIKNNSLLDRVTYFSGLLFTVSQLIKKYPMQRIKIGKYGYIKR